MTDPSKRRGKLSRRQALKAAAGAAGGLALAGLPGKWTKPVVKVGALPAHAAVSGFHTLACGANFFTALTPISGQTSSVTITPGDSGVSMRYSIGSVGGATLATPVSNPGTTLTVGGVASIAFTFTAPSINGSLIVTWSFANPAQGTGSCTQSFSWID